MMFLFRKFNEVLDRTQKIKIAIIVVLMIIGAFLETLGVSLIVPVMTNMLNPDFFKTNKYAVLICKILDLHTSKTFLIAMLVALIIIYIVKDLFLYFEYYVQQRFLCNNKVLLQKQIMTAILKRPYEYFLNITTGEVQRTILSDVDGTFAMLNNVMMIYTEAIVTLVMFIAILIINPIMALVVVVSLCLEMLLIAKVIKPIMAKYGERQRTINAKSNTWIIQSVNGIKDVKVSDKGSFFVENYQKYAVEGAKINRSCNVLNNAPRLIIESVTISVMLAFISILLFFGKDIEQLMPQLSAFAIAAVRMLPSANRISAAFNALPFNEPNLTALNETVRSIRNDKNDDAVDDSDKELTLNKQCELKNVTYSYPNTKSPVLVDANMIIPAGKSVGIVGTTGSGKTTSVDILLGLLNVDKGEVLCDGVNIKDGMSSWISKIGYIPQMMFMLDDTIAANVAFGIDKDDIDIDRVKAALEDAKIMDFIDTLPDGINTRIGERGVRLSGGQRQRIGIARALYNNPELLVFDEATSALDNDTESAIMDSVNSLHGKKTMVIIAHRLTTIEGCDMVYRVDNHKISRER